MAAWVTEPEGLLAAQLTGRAAEAGGLIFLARSEACAGRLARAAAAALAPALRVLLLPAWDCLPYDRGSPSRQVMGLRMAALRALAGGTGGAVLLFASIEAATQRLSPPDALAELAFRAGGGFDEAVVARRLAQLGYVLDVYPPGDSLLPCRIEHEAGRVLSIRRYDPLTQRSVAAAQEDSALGIRGGLAGRCG